MYSTTATSAWRQNGVLGILLAQNAPLPGLNTVSLKGVLVDGKVYLRCDVNILLYLPSNIAPIPSDVVCKIDGVDIPLSKFDVTPTTNVSAAVYNTINVADLFDTYSTDETHALSIDWNAIKAFLDRIVNDIWTYARECGFNIDCVFDKVWDRLVHNFCGGDCDRDCTFNCKWYDVACHLRKVDCERLKAQCKVCEAALSWAKPVVKAYIVALLASVQQAAEPISAAAKSSGCNCSEGHSPRG